MKLELKHLAPYLPYGLKIMAKLWTIDETTLEDVNCDLTMVNIKSHLEKQSKPILRPLSYLDREYLETNGFECHIDWLTTERETWVKKYGNDKYISRLPYGHFIFLIKNHFDVFGLIDQGLAIDINTL